MAYYATSACALEGDPTPENRVWGFFANLNKSSLPNRLQGLEPRRRNRPVTTKVVSGIPVWPSRDPIGETGGINLYEFVGNDGINGFDRLGLITVKPSDGLEPGKCGAFEIQWELGVENQPVGETGWIISNVEFDWGVNDCDGEPVEAPLLMSRDFYEAFGPFSNGGSFSRIVDTWKSSDRHPCTTGSVTITGDMRYYSESRTGNLIPPHPDWTYAGPTTPENEVGPPYRPPSGTAPSTWTESSYYGNPASNEEPTAKISATITWDCCPNFSDQRDNIIETNPSLLGGWRNN